MVSQLASLAGCAAASRWVLAAAEPSEPLLMRLDPASRAKVAMALLALALVGMALVALAWLGGRHFRRIVSKPLPKTSPHEDRWYRNPLVPPEGKHPGARDPE